MSFENTSTDEFLSEKIPFSKTNILPSITLDYLHGSEALEHFYHRYFNDKDFYSQMLEKKLEFTAERRTILRKTLLSQYEKSLIRLDASHPVKRHIDALFEENTFVITTGHQLCLHTGPLYFPYKIISAISMSRRLRELYPEYNFVPIYWMASEDHDFAEINHFHHHQVRFQWSIDHGASPVGRLPLQGYEEVVKAYSEFLKPQNIHTKEWLTILQDSYLHSPTLADATRRLVHHLLGQYGVVVIDGDDAELKKSFRFIIKEELLHQKSTKALRNTSDQIGKVWFAQVNPRDINFFYLSSQGRIRITKDRNEQFSAGEKHWTTAELEAEIDRYPERFSPNVVTRPLFQEFVLPNLAYIGGANELAYWLQLKELFTAHQVPMPILLLRNSFVQLPRKTAKFLQKHTMPTEYIFQSPREIAKKIIKRETAIDSRFDYYRENIDQLYAQIRDYTTSVDSTLAASTETQRIRHIKALEKLKQKTLKAEIRKQQWLTSKLTELHHRVYPNDTLQERYENIGQYYCKYGREWLDWIISEAEMPSKEAIVVFLPD